MKEVSWKTIKRLDSYKRRIEKLYKKIEKEERRLFKRFGEIEQIYEIDPDDEGNKYLRFRIIDNSKKLKEKGACFKVTAVKDVEIEVKRLKKISKEKEILDEAS